MTRPDGEKYDCLLPDYDGADSDAGHGGEAGSEIIDAADGDEGADGGEALHNSDDTVTGSTASATGDSTDSDGSKQANADASQQGAGAGAGAGTQPGGDGGTDDGSTGGSKAEPTEKVDEGSGDAGLQANSAGSLDGVEEADDQEIGDDDDDLASVNNHGSDALLKLLRTGTCFSRNDGYWTYEVCPGVEVRHFHQVHGDDGTFLKREPLYSLGTFATRVAGKVQSRRGETTSEDASGDDTNARKDGPTEVAFARRQLHQRSSVGELKRVLLKRGINVRSLVEKSDLVDAVASSDPALVPADYSKVKTYKKGDLQTFLANKNPVHDSVITFSEETYVGGQYCDEIKQGRSASVHYRCDPKLSHSRQAFIDTIEEVSTCTYKIVISTPLLCAGHRAAARALWEGGVTDATSAASTTGTTSSVTSDTDAGSGKTASSAAGSKSDAAVSPLGHAKQSPWAEVGGTGARLLRQLESQCFTLEDGWWTYQLCVGHHLRQYHLEEGKVTAEYYLGRYTPPTAPPLKPLTPANEPGMSRIDQALVANYTSGTLCDLTDRPRRTRVYFKCGDELESSDKASSLESVSETSSCEYEAVLRSPILCKHAALRPKSTQEVHYVNCYPRTLPDVSDEVATDPGTDEGHALEASVPDDALEGETTLGGEGEASAMLEAAYQGAKELMAEVFGDELHEDVVASLPDTLDAFLSMMEEMDVNLFDPDMVKLITQAVTRADMMDGEDLEAAKTLIDSLLEKVADADEEDEEDDADGASEL